MIVSVTEIHVRDFSGLWKFFGYVRRIRRQLKTAPGLIRFETHGQRFFVFNTVSAWNSDQDMYAFMQSGAHKEAMKAVKKIAKATRYTRRKTDVFPSKKEAIAWLNHDMPGLLVK